LKIDVRHLLAEVTPETLPVSDADPFEAIAGWDSLKMINLVVRLEQLLGRELSETELENLRTIRDLDALLKLT
jgi:acyl carrier protein